ncbi:MAG: DUF3853 family protein [Bacteroidaceae bacterium]|nr:DUF3853 family protein [Bacteroidaceae bacterium]
MNESILSRPVGCLTVQELLSVLDERYKQQVVATQKTAATPEPVFLRGHKELAVFLHCSESSISRLRASGALDGCSIERGKLILYDRDKILQAMSKKKPRKYEHWKRAS